MKPAILSLRLEDAVGGLVYCCIRLAYSLWMSCCPHVRSTMKYRSCAHVQSAVFHLIANVGSMVQILSWQRTVPHSETCERPSNTKHTNGFHTCNPEIHTPCQTVSIRTAVSIRQLKKYCNGCAHLAHVRMEGCYPLFKLLPQTSAHKSICCRSLCANSYLDSCHFFCSALSVFREGSLERCTYSSCSTIVEPRCGAYLFWKRLLL